MSKYLAKLFETLPPMSRLEIFQTYGALIFSLFYFLDPFFKQPDMIIWALIVFVFFVQVLLYHFFATLKNQRFVFVLILFSIFLCFVTTPINNTSYAFYWYCGFFAASRYSIKVAFFILTLIYSSVFISTRVFDLPSFGYLVPVAIPVIGLFCFGFFDKMSRKHALEKERSEEQIEQLAKVAERERIARDLHDVVGHSLTTISLKAQLAAKLSQAGDHQRASNEISELAEISRRALSDVREVVSGYKANSLNHHIEQLVDTLKQWKFEVDNRLDIPDLSPAVESTLVLVLTEAITNIIKHSNGRLVELSSEASSSKYKDAEWALYIRDDGPVDDITPGNGLLGIRERLESIQAILEISTHPGMTLSIYFRKPS